VLLEWLHPVIFWHGGFSGHHCCILQWRIKYGGCEVVSLPIMLFKRRYTTYCIPLAVLDAAERKFTAGLEHVLARSNCRIQDQELRFEGSGKHGLYSEFRWSGP